MDIINRSNSDVASTASAAGLNRRAVLMTAAVAASAAAGVPDGTGGDYSGRKLRRTAGGTSFSRQPAHAEQKAAMIKGVTDVVLKATKQPPDPARHSFVQIFETADGGFGVEGQVFVPRAK